MKDSNVINIVNFIRACEPRLPMDLFQPVKDEMEMAKEWNLPVTWLIQYDALVEGPFVEYLKQEMPANHEIGIWFEVVQANAEAVGVKWCGRYPWDWHVHCGFSVGYTPEQRERIADVFLEKFKSVFGFYPASMGSWFFDARLLAYLHKKYGIRAACNCKDQYGTDGYTLWGGYWANAYYPSIVNAYMPAQSQEMQIDVPVFRMLGSDPLDQYDDNAGTGKTQSVCTLEPVYEPAGGNPAWVDWFFGETFRDPHFALAYAQAGQENSFGSKRITAPLRMQCAKIAALRETGKVRVETLCETADRFREEHKTTPVTACITLQDFKGRNRSGIWYLSKYQRMNFFVDAEGHLRIRDWHVFDEKAEETFLNDVCRSECCYYFTPAIVDGFLWHPCGLRLSGKTGKLENVRQTGEESLAFNFAGISFECTPDGFSVLYPDDTDNMAFSCDWESVKKSGTVIAVNGNTLNCSNEKSEWLLSVENGSVRTDGDRILFYPEKRRIEFKIHVNSGNGGTPL